MGKCECGQSSYPLIVVGNPVCVNCLRKKYRGKIFIYYLSDPRDGFIKYVGYSSDILKRYGEHTRLSCLKRNSKKNAWIKELIKKKLLPIMNIIGEFSQASDAKEEETFLISYFKLCGTELKNGTVGGDGVGSGINHPSFGKPNVCRGKPLSAETRLKISIANTGKVAHNKGKETPQEVKEKISLKNKGRIRSVEERENISKGKKGTPNSEAHKKSMSEAMLKSGKWSGEDNPKFGKYKVSADFYPIMEKMLSEGKTRADIASAFKLDIKYVYQFITRQRKLNIKV